MEDVMKRKCWGIGISVVAVVILAFGSLVNVVGYQSITTTIDNSPLFATRTQRATNQQQNVLTSRYLGIGKGNLLQFPTKDTKTEQFKKVVDFISNMDDTAFTQFTEVCIQKARQDDSLQFIKSSQIAQALHLLKTKPEAIMNSNSERDNHNMTSGYLSCDMPFACLWLLLMLPIATLIMFIFHVLFPTTHVDSCRSHCICQH